MANERDQDRATALYCRISTDEQTHASQEHDLRQRAGQIGGRVLWYRDTISGAAACLPELDRLSRDIAARKVGRVIVWALDRISRRGILDGLAKLRGWLEKGVEVVSLKEPWVQATADPALRELLLSIAFWGAAQERRRISERTKAGMRAAKAAGKKIGRPPGSGRPWALAKRKIDVVLARSLRQQGASVKDIAARFRVSRPAIYQALRS